MRRPFLLSVVLPAVVAAQVGIGDPAVAGSAAVRDADGARVGRLVVERTGDDVTATARFAAAPARRATLCVKVAGRKRCVNRRLDGDGTVHLALTADFERALTARVRC